MYMRLLIKFQNEFNFRIIQPYEVKMKRISTGFSVVLMCENKTYMSHGFDDMEDAQKLIREIFDNDCEIDLTDRSVIFGYPEDVDTV